MLVFLFIMLLFLILQNIETLYLRYFYGRKCTGILDFAVSLNLQLGLHNCYQWARIEQL